MTAAFLDLDDATLIFVPEDARNRHAQLADLGVLAAADPETGAAKPEEVARAEAARAALSADDRDRL